MKLIIKLILMGAAVAIAAYVLPGVEVDTFWWAIIVAVVIALLNGTVGAILRLLTLPLNFLTLGLVSLIITILMVMLASNLLSGFEIGGLRNALVFAVIVWLIGWLFGVDADKD